ncbi:MAG: metallophosphoesterase, partial [Clostridia bacterium]|nr:metallophosphoesterase [Clostridia bacterium]
MKKGLIRALAGAAAFMLSVNLCVFATGAEELQTDPVVTRFVVASDVHVNEDIPSNLERLPKVFENAYAYAEAQGGAIDAFVFNGDNVDGSFTDGVNQAQWKLFLEGVRKNIRGDSKFLMTLARTHDIYDSWGTKMRVTEEQLNALIAETFGTSGEYIAADWGFGSYLTKLNGVAVITLSNDMTNTNNAYNHCNNSREWLKAQLETLVSEDPEQPIFVVYHYPEVGALDYSQRWGS